MKRVFFSSFSLNNLRNSILIYTNFKNIHKKSFTSRLLTTYKMSDDQKPLNAVDAFKLRNVVEILNQFASPLFAEKWDNVGLLIEPATETPVQNIMLTNDLTKNVLKEAIEKKINLIISYHPPIFKPLKEITTNTWKGEIVALCLENRIAVYSPHTTWDAIHGGVADWLADAFSKHLEDEKEFETHPLLPNTDEELLNIDPKSGMGRLLYVKNINIRDCVELIKTHTGLKHVRIALAVDKTMDSPVHVIAVVPGSGGKLLEDTRADLFVTGEMSHHELLEANHNGASVILTNHSDSERGFLKIMKQNLEKLIKGNATIIVSDCDKDPLITL